MVHVDCDSIFELEVEDLDNDEVCESKSSITFYLHPVSSYKKEWWYTNSSNSCRNRQLVYQIEEYVDVTANFVEGIDVEEMLSTAGPPAALITLISEKVLVPLEPAASQDELKELASDVISETRHRLAAKPNINKYTFSIGICIRYHISTSLDENDMKVLQEYKGAAAADDDEYDPSRMPLPIIIDDGYDYYDLGQESCAICWDKYLPGSQVIRMQCFDELDHLIHNNHRHQYLSVRGSDATAIVVPCSHQFHANCIANWLKSTNSCPLCRFQMPSYAILLSILDLFDSEVHPE